MLNQIVLVGRIKEKEDGKIIIDVKDSIKNENGEYSSNLISIFLGENISNSVNEYCEVDSLVGVKGRIQVIDDKMKIIAEKISFLSSKK